MARPEVDPGLGPQDAAELVRLAVATVRDRLSGLAAPAGTTPGTPADPEPVGLPAALRAAGATFVTLERDGRLRGCVGSLQRVRPLYQDVARNAAQAMRDPRLPPVEPAEWTTLTVTVSVLGAPEPVAAGTRGGLEAVLRPGTDGLILTDGVRRATFLPVVWQRLPDPATFVGALLAKGGWDRWPDGMRAWRYTATEYTDRPPRPPLPRGPSTG